MALFDDAASNPWAPTQNPEGLGRQAQVAKCDGYVILAAEYNHGPTGVLKNALDYAHVE
ncbi:MAG: NAD(P)H-dependent oxidoreductase [Firmicutes bacterium]|nr:NAD(P)H-dependent oxidoreductase [Bacillota bacterium]